MPSSQSKDCKPKAAEISSSALARGDCKNGQGPTSRGVSAPNIPFHLAQRASCVMGVPFQDISSVIWQAHEKDGIISLWDHTGSGSGLEEGAGTARPKHGHSVSPGTSAMATTSHSSGRELETSSFKRAWFLPEKIPLISSKCRKLM